LVLSKKKRKHNVYSQRLLWVYGSFTYGKAVWCQLLNWFPAILLAVAIGNSGWLCGNITPFPRFKNQHPSKGKQSLFFSVHVVPCPCFLVRRRACKQLKDCGKKEEALNYKKKIILLQYSWRFYNGQKCTIP
jgi:hypothetical protein